MGIIMDKLGFRMSRNLSKVILMVSAIAVSSYALTTSFLVGVLRFDIGFQMRNWIALSLILIWLFMREELLAPKNIPLLDKTLSKYVYYFLLFLLAIAVSSISFPLLNNLLNIQLFSFPFLAIRNLVAAIILLVVRVIHISG